MTVWIVLGIIAVTVFVLLLCPVSASVTCIHDEAKNKADIEVAYLFIKKRIDLKKKEKKQVDVKANQKEMPEKGIMFYRNLYSLLKEDIKKLLDYLLNKAIVFKNIEIKTEFGFSDPALTGVMCGTQNALFYNIAAYLHNNFDVRNVEVEVNPDFENVRFEAFFNCIVKMKTAHIINVLFCGIKILKKIKKTSKGKEGKNNV